MHQHSQSPKEADILQLQKYVNRLKRHVLQHYGHFENQTQWHLPVAAFQQHKSANSKSRHVNMTYLIKELNNFLHSQKHTTEKEMQDVKGNITCTKEELH
jgi:hypothetical protein